MVLFFFTATFDCLEIARRVGDSEHTACGKCSRVWVLWGNTAHWVAVAVLTWSYFLFNLDDGGLANDLQLASTCFSPMDTFFAMSTITLSSTHSALINSWVISLCRLPFSSIFNLLLLCWFLSYKYRGCLSGVLGEWWQVQKHGSECMGDIRRQD